MPRTCWPLLAFLPASVSFADPTAGVFFPDGVFPVDESPFSAPMWDNSLVEAMLAQEIGGGPGFEAIYGDGNRLVVGALIDRGDLAPSFIDLGDTVLELDAVATNGATTTFVVRTAGSLRLVTVEDNDGEDWIINQTLFSAGVFGDGKRDGVFVCDVTADGVNDIVTFRQGDAQIRVHRGIPGGGFESQPLLSALATEFLASFTLADLDGDGDKDFAGFSSPGGLFPLENLGDGRFASFLNPSPPPFFGTDAVTGVAHDFTGDGHADVAVGTPFSALELWAGDGSGGFANSPVLIPSPTGASVYAIADFNNDGHLDVAAAHFFNLVGIYYGTGTSLSPPVVLRVGNAAAAVVPCDADLDGDTDLVVTHAPFGTPCGPVLIENAGPAAAYTLEALGGLSLLSGASIAVGDFDGNGFNDVLASTLSFSNHVALNSGNADLGPFIDLDAFESFPGLAAVRAADADPRDFIAYRLTSPMQAGWLRYNPDVQTFDFGGFFSLPSAPLDICAADMNSDGREDYLVSYAGGAPAVSIFPQTAAGTFDAPLSVNASTGGKILLASDIDGDGDSDLAFFNDAQLTFAQRLNGWQFTTPITRAVLDLPDLRSAAIANVDGVGSADAVMVGKGPGASDFRLVVMPNFLTSGAATTIDLPALPTDVAAFDFDGDGDDDLAITLDRTGIADAIAVLENDNGFSADRIALSLVGAAPTSLVLADLHEPRVTRGAGTIRSAPEAIALNVGPSFPGFAGVTISANLADVRATPQTPCPGDTNGDNVVNFADLNAVLSAFGQSGAPGFVGADLNNDGVVNFADLNAVLSAFGAQCR